MANQKGMKEFGDLVKEYGQQAGAYLSSTGRSALGQLQARGPLGAGGPNVAYGPQQLSRAGVVSGAGRLAGRYAPLIGGAGALLSGDPLGAIGQVGGGYGGAALGGKIGMTVGGPVGAAIGAGAGALLGGGLGESLLKSGQALAGNLTGNLISGAKGAQREAGKSPGLFGLSGEQIAALSPEERAALIQMAGVGVAEQAYPTVRAMRDDDLQRQMQLNQQVGQLTGALNQQRYLAQLTGKGMGEAGATTRSMINAPNPYAASAFQYNAPGSL